MNYVQRLREDGTKLADDLAKSERIPGQATSKLPQTFDSFVEFYIDSRTDVKPATKEIWRQGRDGLANAFRADCRLNSITEGDADGYKLSMISEGLARFGGFRCPSEVLSVRWCDVHWQEIRLVVHSPKTEHHPGKNKRTIPLFPELKTPLQEAFELRFIDTGYDPARDGKEYMVNERFRRAAIGTAGWRNINLRTTLLKLIDRAGLSKWPRLLHNLRSSCETELADEFPLHGVSEWMGHNVQIAAKHYTQVMSAHFDRAANNAQRKAQQQVTAIGENGR